MTTVLCKLEDLMSPEENPTSNSLACLQGWDRKGGRVDGFSPPKNKKNQDFTPLNNSKDTERGGVLLYEKHFNCCDDVM